MKPEVSGIGIRTIAIEIDPLQIDRAQSMFSDTESSSDFYFNGEVKYDRDGKETMQGRINRMLPNLHFMSFLIFDDQHHDPLLVIELNYDGEPGKLWPALENCMGAELRTLFECTKRPRNHLQNMFDRALLDEHPAPLAPYLEAIASKPTTPYRGMRGLNRQQILQEHNLYNDVQAILDCKSRNELKSPDVIHKTLRDNLSDQYASLFERYTDSAIPWKPRFTDWLLFVGAIALAYLFILFGLGSPVWILSLINVVASAGFSFKLICAVAFIASFLLLYTAKQPARDVSEKLLKEKFTSLFLNSGLALLISTFLALALLGFQTIVLTIFIVILAPVVWLVYVIVGNTSTSSHSTVSVESTGFFDSFGNLLCSVLCSFSDYSFVALVFGISALWAWLRYREIADSAHDGARPEVDILRSMAKRENHHVQNHMGSLLSVRPGILRHVLVRLSHTVLASLARTVFSSGILGSMRTIHFAHWVFVDKGNRLLFLSNFDGSWESYLDDFTEKASVGVNIAWAQCIGFPKSFFVIGEGSKRGGQFKNWARHSMTETLFWYSAYPELSVGMIHRNNRLARGLSQKQLAKNNDWIREL